MWQEKDNSLYKKFTFKDFTDAFNFMKKVADLAEELNHHPRWLNQWNTVEVWLNTHDQGNMVTDKDRKLSKAIDQLLENKDEEKSSLNKISKTSPRAVKLFADGGSRGNPGPSAGGFVILDQDDKLLLESGKYLGITTNNQAEYHSLKGGLEAALKQNIREVDVFMDSMLVVNQMKGIYKIRNRDLWPIHEAIKQLVSKFDKVTFTHVPRAFNKLADAMVNKVLDERVRT